MKNFDYGNFMCNIIRHDLVKDTKEPIKYTGGRFINSKILPEKDDVIYLENYDGNSHTVLDVVMRIDKDGYGNVDIIVS